MYYNCHCISTLQPSLYQCIIAGTVLVYYKLQLPLCYCYCKSVLLSLYQLLEVYHIFHSVSQMCSIPGLLAWLLLTNCITPHFLLSHRPVASTLGQTVLHLTCHNISQQILLNTVLSNSKPWPVLGTKQKTLSFHSCFWFCKKKMPQSGITQALYATLAWACFLYVFHFF